MRSQSSDHHQKEIIKQLKKSNYYDILELKHNASDAQIKKSFKQMALRYHPDKNSASCSKQVFHRISEAYDTLSDPFKRTAYDQKNSGPNMLRRQYSFGQPTMFYYRASSFNQQYGARFRNYSDFDRKRSAQFKMDEKARQQRQWYKRQHNQKNKNSYTGYKNPFYKDTSHNKTSSNEKFTQSKNNNQESSKKQYQYTGYKKYTYSKPSQNRSQSDQIRQQNQRKIRFDKQKQKAQKNIRMFVLFVFILIVWVAFSYFGPMMKGIPVYSMKPSQNYNIPRFTKQLNSPFYVTADYLQRAQANDKFRQYLDRKVDLVYIKTISKVCNIMRQKQEELYDTLEVVKSKKSKKQIDQRIQDIDISACELLYEARQRNPVYFKKLFTDPASNKNQM